MVEIRKLRRTDIKNFLNWRGTDDYTAGVVRKEIDEHFQGARVIFVAVIGEELVGTVQFVPFHRDPEMSDGLTSGYLQALEVKPQYRNRGIGTALMRRVEEECLRRGMWRITLSAAPDNDTAIRLYEKLGYEAFKDSVFYWRDKELPALCFEKHLNDDPDVPMDAT